MRYHMISVTMNHDGSIDIYDMSQLIYQSKMRSREFRGQIFDAVEGQKHTVYVIDPYEDFSREQRVAMATKFLLGDYEIYSLSTGETRRGKRILE